MINRKNVIRYCCDDISLIKNYDEANISDEKYDCHHLLESDYSRQELIDLNLYWDRPASELIFLKHKDHISLHHKLNTYDFMHKPYKHNAETIAKIALANTGKKRSEETKLKMSLARTGNPGKHYAHSEETKQKMRKKHNCVNVNRSGSNNGMYGKHHSEETKLKMSLAHRKVGQEPGSYPNIISNYL